MLLSREFEYFESCVDSDRVARCSLEAADEAGCLVRVYAVEKNPNAVVT